MELLEDRLMLEQYRADIISAEERSMLEQRQMRERERMDNRRMMEQRFMDQRNMDDQTNMDRRNEMDQYRMDQRNNLDQVTNQKLGSNSDDVEFSMIVANRTSWREGT